MKVVLLVPSTVMFPVVLPAKVTRSSVLTVVSDILRATAWPAVTPEVVLIKSARVSFSIVAVITPVLKQQQH